MRQLKSYLKSRNTMRGCVPCECATLKCRREATCNCEPVDNSFSFTGYTFTMPWTKKTWTISSWTGYITFSDGDTKFHILETGSAITANMVNNNDVVIIDNADYMKLAMLYDEIQNNVRENWENAKTELSDDEKEVIVSWFTTLKDQQVWFEWDGRTFWNNNNNFPLYNVVDYNGKVLGQQWLLETWGKFAYLDGKLWDTYMDYYTALLQAWATKMKIDYDFSATIREWFELNNRPSKWGLTDSGYACYVPTTDNYMYKLSFTNDGKLQVILAEVGRWIPWVTEWKVVTLSNEAEEYIAHNREGWIYLDAIGDEMVLWEIA